MCNALIGKTSQKGQIVIPTTQDWFYLVKGIPVEDVKMDKHGHYDPKKSPDFHDWMVNG